MLIFLILNAVIALSVGVQVCLAYRKWSQWIDRISTRASVFDKPRRFGWRSWIARSFILDTPTAEVVKRINELTEQEWPANTTAQHSSQSYLSAIAPLISAGKVPTGIEVEWIDSNTARIMARQYADWPELVCCDKALPFRQNQLTVRDLFVYVEENPGGGTKLSYEAQTPIWLFALLGTIVLFIVWIARALWWFQVSRHATKVLTPLNVLVLVIILFWIALLCVRVLRLQSVSLLDSLVYSLGNMRNSNSV